MLTIWQACVQCWDLGFSGSRFSALGSRASGLGRVHLGVGAYGSQIGVHM